MISRSWRASSMPHIFAFVLSRAWLMEFEVHDAHAQLESRGRRQGTGLHNLASISLDCPSILDPPKLLSVEVGLSTHPVRSPPITCHGSSQANNNGMAQVGVWHHEMAEAYSTGLKERGIISEVYPAD